MDVLYLMENPPGCPEDTWTTLRLAHTLHRIEGDDACTTPHAGSLIVGLALGPAAMVRIYGRRALMGAIHLPVRGEARAEPAFVSPKTVSQHVRPVSATAFHGRWQARFEGERQQPCEHPSYTIWLALKRLTSGAEASWASAEAPGWFTRHTPESTGERSSRRLPGVPQHLLPHAHVRDVRDRRLSLTYGRSPGMVERHVPVERVRRRQGAGYRLHTGVQARLGGRARRHVL